MCSEDNLRQSTISKMKAHTRKPSPLENASYLSRFFFTWCNEILKRGKEGPLTENDLPNIALLEKSSYRLDYVTKMWEDELKRVEIKNRNNRKDRNKYKPSLARAMFIDYLKTVWFVQPLLGLWSASKIVQALALGYLIEYFSEGDKNSLDGYFWAGVIVICAILSLFIHHQVYFWNWRKGCQIRVSIVAAIFAKSLHLRSIGIDSSSSSGKIVNIASNDVERFLNCSLFISYLWWAPIEAIVIFLIGFNMIGIAFAVGYGLLLLFVPLQYYLSIRFSSLRMKIASITDARVSLVSQVVSGIRVIKMNGWELQFVDRISDLRKKEVNQIQKANRLKALNEAIFFACSITICIVIYVVHVALGGTLNPKIVFTTMTLINCVQLNLAKFFSFGVQSCAESYVSLSRIQAFLQLPELRKEVVNTVDGGISNGEIAISLKDVNCYWESGDLQSTDGTVDTSDFGMKIENHSLKALDNISVDLEFGKLYCVIGQVGSGKSAFLQYLAGELTGEAKEAKKNYNSLSYATQDVWIMNGTVRENICMGLEFEKKSYEEIIIACGLNVDFLQFPNADETIVGDRGVQCSGGQRARIGLARALYRDSDILLLDDPLSAVDSRVGRLIFNSAICDIALKRGKCVVLVTHQHQFVGEHTCILMSEGRINCIGSYHDCLQLSNGKLVSSHQAINDDNIEKCVYPNSQGLNKQEILSEISSTNVETEAKDVSAILEGKDSTKAEENAHTETHETGKLSFGTWLAYMNAFGGIGIVFVLTILFSLSQASLIIAIVYIGQWSSMPIYEQSSKQTISYILGIGASIIIFAVIRAAFCFSVLLKASQRLHDNMATAIIRAKIIFFDTNPIGRILNRFSADVGINDDLLPMTMYDFCVCLFVVFGGIATAIMVLPLILITLPPLIWYFIRLRRTFIISSRELKRLEGKARSPIFAMISESLNGISTIRSNNYSDYFQQKFEEAQDSHTRAFFMYMGISRWLGFRLDSIVVILIILSTFVTVLFYSHEWFNINPTFLGLAMTLLLQLAGTFQWTVRQSAEVVNQMVSVERVHEYGKIASEAALSTDKDLNLEEWPTKGSIELCNLSARYRPELQPSLRSLSCFVENGHRVGVVGRTGSGKSTMIQALFRLLEAESGKVIIDGIDISTIGLHKVRTKMSVIPQFPVLFSGCTVRENLDPFGVWSDKIIFDALRDVQMLSVIEGLPQNLNSLVAEGGSNFSVGQRQLLALSRAIIRKSKILVLDEPTANVDRKTDSLLQEAIAKSFSGSTIIAVAHRLDTVIDYDRILVLGNGSRIEFGAPWELLSNKDSYFAKMVNDTGKKTAEELRDKARKAFLKINP